MRNVLILPALLGLLAGCTGGGTDKHDHKTKGHGHSHERDKMLLADAGKYHAALTAHLSSKEGNELDVFLETMGNPPKPAPLPIEMFMAQATTSDGQTHELKFEPTPISERKDDPPGLCSRFVAPAWWMKADDKLKVVAKLTIDGKKVTVQWKEFHPKKYAHHDDSENTGK